MFASLLLFVSMSVADVPRPVFVERSPVPTFRPVLAPTWSIRADQVKPDQAKVPAPKFLPKPDQSEPDQTCGPEGCRPAGLLGGLHWRKGPNGFWRLSK